MSTLDQSLDQIIASNRKAKATGRVKKALGKTIGRSKASKVTKAPRASTAKKQRPSLGSASAAATAISIAGLKTVDLTYATKVLCSNLPRDLKQENIKEFFQTQVGGVNGVIMNFNEKGRFNGTATVSFKNNNKAAIAVEKYNGAPIDNGEIKLKLEILIDTSKQPLATRIAPIAANGNVEGTGRNSRQRKPDPQQSKPSAAAKKTGTKPAGRRPPKKTLEDLDQDMADYFTK